MRLMAASLVPLLFAPLVAAAATPVVAPGYQIVLPRRAVAAGERLDLKLVPPPPLGAGVAWFVKLTEGEGMGLPGGVYWAPYLIPSGAPPAEVTVRIRDGGEVDFAKAEIELMPGSVPGAEDCLGPNQTFSIAAATLTPPNPVFDTWPELVKRIEPVYPRSAFVRGISDTIPVMAMVCRTGNVLDAHEVLAYRDTGDPFNPDPNSLIEHDPKLVEAAVAAVRQYVFTPAILGGHPIAFQILTAVLFNPTERHREIDSGRASPSASIAPNPMNPAGTIAFSTATPGRVRVTLFDIQGRHVRTLLDMQAAPPGPKRVQVGESAATGGEKLATGVYFYRVETADGTATGRLVVLR